MIVCVKHCDRPPTPPPFTGSPTSPRPQSHLPGVGAAPPKQVLINVKVAEGTAVALAKRAVAEGVTEKQLVIQALEAIGLPINPYDREDRRAPRRADAA